MNENQAISDHRLDQLLATTDQAAIAALDGHLDPKAFIDHARGRSRHLAPISANTRMSGLPAADEIDEEAPDWLSHLSPVEKSLLERLASGATIAAAATAEFLSLRTAKRRIADIRRRAGVGTTRELVGQYKSIR